MTKDQTTENNQLGQRELYFLTKIVSEYIRIAEPVSSRHLANLPGVSLSSASIRNIMWDLTEKGYLIQPHTSSGRVPSDSGYRYFVNQIQNNEDVVNQNQLKFKLQNANMEELLKECLQHLANDTKLASLATSPKPENLLLKSIEILDLDENRLLVIIVSESGLVSHKIISLKHTFNKDFLLKLSVKLSDIFKGSSIVHMKEEIIATLSSEQLALDSNNFKATVSLMNHVLDLQNEYQIFFAGRMYVTSWTELKSREEVDGVYKEIEDGLQLKKLLNLHSNQMNVYFKIGGELNLKSFDNCALVAANYGMEQNNLGTIGVIGPKRMDYQRVALLVEAIARLISNNFNK